MTRITPVDPESDDELRVRVTHAIALFGRPLLPQQVLAHSPGYPKAYAATTAWTAEKSTVIDADVRALAMQLVAEINGCAWCIDYGRFTASARGVAMAKLAGVRDYASSELFDRTERAALAYAAEVTAVGCRVSDETFAELARCFSEREIVELTAAVAIENFYNRLNAPLEIDAQGFCSITLGGPAFGERAS